MEERDPTKNEQIIQELRAEVETLKAEKEEIKEKMKVPKALRTKSAKYLKKLKQKLRKTHDRVRRRRTWQKKQNEKK